MAPVGATRVPATSDRKGAIVPRRLLVSGADPDRGGTVTGPDGGTRATTSSSGEADERTGH